jgi:hypothetical protein
LLAQILRCSNAALAALLLALILAAAAATVLTTSASAMEFHILPMPDGLRIVFAVGDIVGFTLPFWM